MTFDFNPLYVAGEAYLGTGLLVRIKSLLITINIGITLYTSVKKNYVRALLMSEMERECQT